MGVPALLHLRSYRLQILLLMCACVAAVAAFAPPASAQSGESARDYVHPHVTRIQYQQLLDAVNLDRDQQFIVGALYSDYASIIDAAVESADAQAEAAGRDTVDAVLSGRMRIAPDELRDMRAAVVQTYTDVFVAADAAFEHLITSTEAVLTESQARQAGPAIRELKRNVFLEPARREQFASDYAGEGVELLQLAAEARDDGGALASVDDRKLQSLLEQYEMQLDQQLHELSAQMRQASVQRRVASILRDDRAARTAEARMLQPWQRLYELNRRTASAIGELIDSPADRQAWMDRYHIACFPWLLAQELPDRQYQWLAQQSLAEPAWTQIEQAYRQYTQQRRTLAESMIELIIDARLSLGVVMHPMMNPTDVPDDATEFYEQMIRITGEQKANRSQVRDAFNAVLSDAQRKAMNRAVR